MKKTLSFILMLIFLSLAGCASQTEFSDTSSVDTRRTIEYEDLDISTNPVALIGDGTLSGVAYGPSPKTEIEYAHVGSAIGDRVDSMIGTTKTVEIYGAILEGTYFGTYYNFKKEPINHAFMSTEGSFKIDTNGQVVGFSLDELPESYDAKTEPKTKEELEQLAIEYIGTTMNVFTDGFVVRDIWGSPSKEPVEYEVLLYFYKNEIHMLTSSIKIDICGNVRSFSMTDLNTWKDVKVPTWDKQLYLDAATKRLEDTYKDTEIEKLVCSFSAPYPELFQDIGRMTYIEQLETYAIESYIWYTVTEIGGRESSACWIFYFPFEF